MDYTSTKFHHNRTNTCKSFATNCLNTRKREKSTEKNPSVHSLLPPSYLYKHVKLTLIFTQPLLLNIRPRASLRVCQRNVRLWVSGIWGPSGDSSSRGREHHIVVREHRLVVALSSRPYVIRKSYHLVRRFGCQLQLVLFYVTRTWDANDGTRLEMTERKRWEWTGLGSTGKWEAGLNIGIHCHKTKHGEKWTKTDKQCRTRSKRVKQDTMVHASMANGSWDRGRERRDRREWQTINHGTETKIWHDKSV